MNGRFKFRVWDKELKYFHDQPDYFLSNNGKLHTVTLNHRKEVDVIEIENSENYVVQQCTGLKDEYLQDIYEGDLLINYSARDENFHDLDYEEQQKNKDIYTISWFSPTASFRQVSSVTGKWEEMEEQRIKIIGNIFKGIKNED